MSGVILALPGRPETARQVLEASARLAELTGSVRSNVLAILTPPLSTIMLTEEILTREQEKRIRADENCRADALRHIFEDWSRGTSASNLIFEWAVAEGLADELVIEWGRRADFMVLTRPTHRQLDQERLAIHAALFDCDRPVLVVPPDAPASPFGRRIAIAWRDDERTIKAVLSGLRCVAKAEDIHVLAGTRDASRRPRSPEILDEHGITAKLHILPIAGQEVFGERLLRTAHQLNADMLIVGAFARHPLRSLILGGVTRYMLAHADIPLLMRH